MNFLSRFRSIIVHGRKGKFWLFLKVVISPKPDKPHPPKLVCMHVTSTPTWIIFWADSNQLNFLMTIDYSSWSERKIWPNLKLILSPKSERPWCRCKCISRQPQIACFGKQLFSICILIVWMEQVFINKINYCSSASNNNNNNNNVIGTWSNPIVSNYDRHWTFCE